MSVVFLWFILSILVGFYAATKGYSKFGFFLYSLIFSPLIGFLFALIAKTDYERLERIEMKKGISKRCQDCAEFIRKEASVCRFCGKAQT